MTPRGMIPSRRRPIKDPSIDRLTEMLSLLTQLEEEEEELNSRILGRYLHVTSDSVRKDISGLKRDTKGGGYRGEELADQIRSTLGLTEPPAVCLCGLGPLGQHLMGLLHRSEEVRLVAAFDGRMNRIERLDAPVELHPAWDLEEICLRHGVELGVITTGGGEAEKTAGRMTAGGVKAILNLSGRYLPREESGPLIKNVNFGAVLLGLAGRLETL